MIKNSFLAAAALAALPAHALAEEAEPEGAPSPNAIVAEAAAEEWITIAADDLLVMTLAPDAEGNERKVVIQLMPAPFSQGWISNIRTLARAGWYDNISVNRVQDNYVVQWGDPNYDNPEATGEAKPMPEGLATVPQSAYITTFKASMLKYRWTQQGRRLAVKPDLPTLSPPKESQAPRFSDAYASNLGFVSGFPVAMTMIVDSKMPFEELSAGSYSPDELWPVHCYGMVGVGRSYSPDTGSGAELYTVIGHAPRHLDRNIALVGRIISGMEHLSSLPRGKGDLGFYAADEIDKRTPILSIRVASDLPADQQPRFEYLSTESDSFARYAEARANRRDPFFIVPAGGADICNIPVPVQRVSE